MSVAIDSVLLVAFGSPEKGGDGEAFVRGIVGNRPGADARVKEVAGHYERLGGSPFNKLTYDQGAALEAELKTRGVNLPVKVGFRHWHPFCNQTIKEMTAAGFKRSIGVVLAPHQCWISDEWYRETVEAAQKEAGPAAPSVEYIGGWSTHYNFVKAEADLIRKSAESMGYDRWSKAALVFCAHAIPIGGCKQCKSGERKCPYSELFEQSARAVSDELGGKPFSLAYQSQAEYSRPWTQPDINSAIKDLAPKGVKDVVVVPIGFLCDHVEVLYDLDIEAKETAHACGMGFHRVPTVAAHPKFISMLADLVATKFRTAV